MAKTFSRTCAALVVLACLVGCSPTTKFISTWKAPDSAPLSVKPGDLVVAMVMSKQESTRRTGEDLIAEQLRKRGLRPIPSFTLIPTDQAGDQEKAMAVIRESGATAVVAVRPIAVNTQQTYVPPTYTGGPYGGWGPYYGYGWNAAYSPGYVVTDTIVRVEVLVYDLRQGKLLWAGQSESTNPGQLDEFIAELAKAASAKMTQQGVLVPPAS